MGKNEEAKHLQRFKVGLNSNWCIFRFRQILKKIVDTKTEMGKNMRDSAFALTEAKYAAGDFRHTVFDAVETVRPASFISMISQSQAVSSALQPH